jgi:hypothetical protein
MAEQVVGKFREAEVEWARGKPEPEEARNSTCPRRHIDRGSGSTADWKRLRQNGWNAEGSFTDPQGSALCHAVEANDLAAMERLVKARVAVNAQG